jgi:hypothetical protein
MAGATSFSKLQIVSGRSTLELSVYPFHELIFAVWFYKQGRTTVWVGFGTNVLIPAEEMLT